MLLLLPVQASAAQKSVTPAAAACAQRAYAPYAEALADWQRRAAEDLARQRPALAAVARLQAQSEASRLSRQTLRARYLAVNAPGRLRLDQGVGAVGEFAWSEADESRARAADPDYPSIASAAEQAERAFRRHPQLGALEKVQREQVVGSPAHLAGLQGLVPKLEAAQKALKACEALLGTTAPTTHPDPAAPKRRPSARIE